MATILYVDDEPAVGIMLEHTLGRAGHQALGAPSVPEAMQLLAARDVDLIISDYGMSGLTGLGFLALLQQAGVHTPLIMLTGYASIEHAVAAIRAGAVNYITKPVSPQQLELAIAQALELVRHRRENDALRQEVLELRDERQATARYALPSYVSPTMAMPMVGTGCGGDGGIGRPAVTLTSYNVDAAEAVLIRHALEAVGQNRTRAAELLGISVRTLRNKLNGPARAIER